MTINMLSKDSGVSVIFTFLNYCSNVFSCSLVSRKLGADSPPPPPPLSHTHFAHARTQAPPKKAFYVLFSPFSFLLVVSFLSPRTTLEVSQSVAPRDLEKRQKVTLKKKYAAVGKRKNQSKKAKAIPPPQNSSTVAV